VTPHHLAFIDEDLATYDTTKKMNPPLRTAEDRDALRHGVADGTIDVIATDHAPTPWRRRTWSSTSRRPARSGSRPRSPLSHVPRRARDDRPAARDRGTLNRAGADPRGVGPRRPLEPGRPANLVVFDPDEEWTVEPPFVSKARNSAFTGQRVARRVMFTDAPRLLHRRRGKPTR
jgi:dihydroorotase